MHLDQIFLSTLSLRRATPWGSFWWGVFSISIHALLAESDLISVITTAGFDQISIHALLAESDVERAAAPVHKNIFLSTLSLRRATRGSAVPGGPETYFYPRSPCGERRYAVALQLAVQEISIHALLAESDGKGSRRCVLSGISIHALLAESDAVCVKGADIAAEDFYPRSPCGERLTFH